MFENLLLSRRLGLPSPRAGGLHLRSIWGPAMCLVYLGIQLAGSVPRRQPPDNFPAKATTRQANCACEAGLIGTADVGQPVRPYS